MAQRSPARVLVRRSAGLWAYESALARAGFEPVAGVDEAGRGACAGPLVVAAAVLGPGRRGRIAELADSKALSPAARERVYSEVVRRALAWSVVVIPAAEVDARGLHVTNVEGMRRALHRLGVAPAYVLTDGFPVSGLGCPALAVWKGDAVTASIAAAGVLAKVTRDRIMQSVHEQYPDYDFAVHKGYVTGAHSRALHRHGPCPEHRLSYVNVARSLAGSAGFLTAAQPGSDLRSVPSRTIRRLAQFGGHGSSAAESEGAEEVRT